MKRHAIPTTISALIIAIILLPAFVFSQTTPGVTGAGAGVFPGGTALAGIPVSGLKFGMGVFIHSDSSAAGEFQATLAGTSLLGQPQNIEVEGQASTGSIDANGSGTFSGTATVDMGDGTLPLTNVPFTVTATPTSLLLVLGSTNLPAAAVTEGSVTVQ